MEKRDILFSVVVLSVFIVSAALGIATAGNEPSGCVGLAESKDMSSITHTFHNTNPVNTYDDLHIEYTKTMDGASNPEITTAGGAVVTGKSKKDTKLDIKGRFPPGSSVKVKAYSTEPGLKVKQYWWTLGGKKIGTTIPVYNYESISLTKIKRGVFSYSCTVKKPAASVKVILTGATNIVGSTGGITVVKNPVGGRNTKITLTGTLINPKEIGKLSVIVDPPDEIFDLVLEIVPQVETSIVTDKTAYTTGDIMTISIDIPNPTEDSVTFQWYWGVPQFSILAPVMSVPILTGYDDTLDFRFTVPGMAWSPAPFGNVFYVQLLDADGEVLDADVTWWAYSPSGKAMPGAEVDTAKEIAERIEKEIKKIAERIEFPN